MKFPIDTCEFLSWDSDFFGFRIGRITARSLSPSVVGAIHDWSSANNIDCLYYIADSDDIQSIRLAEENGFRNVEIRITYELSLDNWDPDTRKKRNSDIHLRLASVQDLPELIDMSKDSFVNSRWYFDPNFPKSKTRAYYPVWIENSINGFADFVLAAELGGQVLGYISGNRGKDGLEGTLEIMAVRSEARGLGIGHELFSGGLDWHVRDGEKQIITNTQGRNITTNRMLIRLGLNIKDIQIYYHKWFSNQLP